MTCPNCNGKTIGTYAHDQEWCTECGALITLTNSGHVRRFRAPEPEGSVPSVLLADSGDLTHVWLIKRDGKFVSAHLDGEIAAKKARPGDIVWHFVEAGEDACLRI